VDSTFGERFFQVLNLWFQEANVESSVEFSAGQFLNLVDHAYTEP
jgi:hypothetical protein